MKRILKIIMIGFVTFFYSTSVLASTNTFERTEENNYLVNGKDIEISDANLGSILSTPAVNASDKLYDFANLYTDSEEKKLYSIISEYVETYHLDLVVVTIRDNQKVSTRAYAEDFYDYNDFGLGSNYDGVLFLIDMQNREFYMLNSGAGMNIYTESRIDICLDTVFSYMADGDYYNGTRKFIEKISEFASIGKPNEFGEEPRVKGVLKLKRMPWSSIAIGSFIATVVVMYILVRKSKLVRVANSSRHYLNNVDIHFVNEVFLGRNVTRSARSHDSSSDGGGQSGSSSSISHGSSGRSHSGGGRKF